MPNDKYICIYIDAHAQWEASFLFTFVYFVVHSRTACRGFLFLRNIGEGNPGRKTPPRFSPAPVRSREQVNTSKHK